MTAALSGIGELIESRPGVQGGRPCIAGTGITAYRIAHLALKEGLSPEAIIREVFDGDVTLAQVHAALAFYFQNREAIDAEVAESDRLYEEHAAAAQSLADRPRR